jgi:hypothetical protein
MEQSLESVMDGLSASQEIPDFLWNHIVRHRLKLIHSVVL